jgi:hypothetical protein
MNNRNLTLALCAFFLAIAPTAMAAEKPGNGVHRFKNINAPGAFETDTNAINNLGIIAGDYIDKSGVQHGMILNGKKLTSVDRKNCTSKPGLTAISFYGINTKSIAVGWCMDSVTGANDAFSYSKGQFVTISPPGATSTQVQGINDKGQIVGTYIDSSSVEHGFLLSGGQYETLDVPNGYTNSDAWAINKKGLITIFAVNSKGFYDSFLFNGKTYTMIDVPNEADSFVTGIDSFGDRVYSVVDSSSNIHGAFFLNVKGGTYFVFNDPKGATNTQAFGLNDKLKIIGTYAPSSASTTAPYQGYDAIGCCRGLPPGRVH